MYTTTITVQAETRDHETVQDFVNALQNLAPYVFDNVIVRSNTEVLEVR